MPRGKNLPFCGRHSRRTGLPCRNKVVTGHKTCRMHGSGTRKRVLEGTRKPAGRPIITGEWADPDLPKNRTGRLGELITQFETDPELLDMRKQVAISKAVMFWMWERYTSTNGADWDVMKSMTESGPVLEHPATWFIKQAEVVQAITYKALSATFKNQIRAACAIVQPAVKVFQDAIERFVPADAQKDCRKWVADALGEIVIKTGEC